MRVLALPMYQPERRAQNQQAKLHRLPGTVTLHAGCDSCRQSQNEEPRARSQLAGPTIVESASWCRTIVCDRWVLRLGGLDYITVAVGQGDLQRLPPQPPRHQPPALIVTLALAKMQLLDDLHTLGLGLH